MTVETVSTRLNETWQLVSGAAAGAFQATFDGVDGALFWIGDTAPATTQASGLYWRKASFDDLPAKIWARSLAGSEGILAVVRTVSALNPAPRP